MINTYILGFTKRNTNIFTSANCLRTVYLALIRSILEYDGVVWHPYLAKDQLRLERDQNTFLSYAAFVFKLQHTPYNYFLVLDAFPNILRFHLTQSLHRCLDRLLGLFNGQECTRRGKVEVLKLKTIEIWCCRKRFKIQLNSKVTNRETLKKKKNLLS